MINVAALWRHPIKSHGREAIESVILTEGHTMPWDRKWAVTHEDCKCDPDDPRWVMCRNFMIGTATPGLAGIWAELDEATATLTLRHDALGQHRFRPDDADDWEGFINWVLPLCPADKRHPTGIVAAPERGMTDTDYPTISIMTRASHAAVEHLLGHPLEVERWRGNIWLDGTQAWEETTWVGKTLQIGTALVEVIEPIERCKHTTANPMTGQRDVDTLAALRDGWDHQNFGVYAKPIQSVKIALNDKVEVL